jgi:dCTP deaminase
MILCRESILEAYNKGEIVIDPFDIRLVNPNSVDIRLGSTLYRMKSSFGIRDLYNPSDDLWEEVSSVPAAQIRAGGIDGLLPAPDWGEGVIPDDAPVFCLNPGEFYLATTYESIGTRALAPDQDSIIPEMKAKSTFGRQGLTVALCAGLGDVGYCSKWALEIRLVGRSVVPLAVGTPIGQVVFHQGTPTQSVYGGAGHYQVEGEVRFLPKPLKWMPRQVDSAQP